jgi:hypothetical protein
VAREKEAQPSKNKAGERAKKVGTSEGKTAKEAEPLKERGAKMRSGNRVADLRAPQSKSRKQSFRNTGALDMPPPLSGCEWSEAGNGWNLFRCRKEKERLMGKSIEKKRYAGHLSREAWEVMKEYDYQTFIEVVAQRLR